MLAVAKESDGSEANEGEGGQDEVFNGSEELPPRPTLHDRLAAERHVPRPVPSLGLEVGTRVRASGLRFLPATHGTAGTPRALRASLALRVKRASRAFWALRPAPEAFITNSTSKQRHQ